MKSWRMIIMGYKLYLRYYLYLTCILDHGGCATSEENSLVQSTALFNAELGDKGTLKVRERDIVVRIHELSEVEAERMGRVSPWWGYNIDRGTIPQPQIDEIIYNGLTWNSIARTARQGSARTSCPCRERGSSRETSGTIGTGW